MHWWRREDCWRCEHNPHDAFARSLLIVAERRRARAGFLREKPRGSSRLPVVAPAARDRSRRLEHRGRFHLSVDEFIARRAMPAFSLGVSFHLKPGAGRSNSPLLRAVRTHATTPRSTNNAPQATLNCPVVDTHHISKYRATLGEFGLQLCVSRSHNIYELFACTWNSLMA